LRRIQMTGVTIRKTLAIMLVIVLTTIAIGTFAVPDAAAEAASPSGTVWEWGYNSDGELGNRTNANSNIPVQVGLTGLPSGVTITTIAGGGTHSLALASNSTVWAWGNNYYGELGNGSYNGSNIPVQVSLPSLPSGVTITKIACGENHSLALASNGTVWAWGWNAYGQIGNRSYNGSNVPVQVSLPSLPSGVTMTSISCGELHSLALASNGTVWAWGWNAYGQLGNGFDNYGSNIPVQVSIPSGFIITKIAGWGYHSLALASNGTVWAWGQSTTTFSNIPVQVGLTGLPNGVIITNIECGELHNLALASNGTVWAWGLNYDGELGNGTNTDSNIPVQVSLPSGVTISNIAGGGWHSLALASNNTVWAWGSNGDGELGNGSYNGSNIPVQVSLPSLPSGVTITKITCGRIFSLALASNTPGTTILSIRTDNLQLLQSFGLPPSSAYVPISGSKNQYYNLLWDYGKQLDVPDNLKNSKTDSNENSIYTQLSRQDINGVVALPGDCVSAADALSDYKFGALGWVKGNPVMATGTTVTEGTVIATFGSDGTYTGHAAIFKKYTDDKTGFWVWDQNWLTRGEFGTHLLDTAGTDFTGNANNYYVVLIPQTKWSATSIQNGSASVADNIAIAVTISGSSAVDGTSATLTSAYYGGISPPGTTTLLLASPSYYDINISSVSNLGANAVAQVYISNPLVTPQTLMKYFDGQLWNSVPNLIISGTTISGFLPVSALGGTPFVIGTNNPIVGMTIMPVNKLGLLVPWVAIGCIGIAGLVFWMAIRKRIYRI
jgi:Regulator of chromosome condensation (RCC1) repeat